MKTKYIIQICILVAVTILFVTPLYAAYDSSLVAYWKLDETTGSTAYDSTTNDNDGTIHDATKGVAGRYGGAFEFDGVDDYVKVDLDVNELDGIKTISVWINGEKSESSYNDIIVVKNPTSYYPGISVHENLDGVVHFYDDNANLITTKLLESGWHNYVMTIHGTESEYNATVYFDGSFSSTKIISSSDIFNNNNNLYIGGNEYSGANDRIFNGTIDDVAIYNRALDANEVASTFNVGTETFERISGAINNPLGENGFNLDELEEYGTAEIKELADVYALMGIKEFSKDLITWRYLDSDNPVWSWADTQGYSEGDAFITNGNYYIMLGSGLEGNPIPEPISCIGFVLGIVGLAIKGKFE